MILYKGEVYPDGKQEELISSLEGDMLETLQNNRTLTYNDVIDACDKLYQRVMNHEFDNIVLPLLEMANMPYSTFERYAKYFSKEGLLKKIDIELGDLKNGELDLDEENTRHYEPLGILFHIAAGNVDLLPAYSVVEGLLVGNINILKLPTGDNGMSIRLLQELIKESPILKDYIYVFDVPSTEVETIKQLANLADATIVWGGDMAQKAARTFVDIHSSIISWGHKISFTYVDKNVTDEELKALCESICATNQLFCSSSQGIYVNTDDVNELKALAERILPLFAETSKKMGTLPLTMKAKNSLLIYNEKLEGNADKVFMKDGVSIIVKEDNKLELSFLFQNIWIKPLKKEDIIKVLKPNKNLLQTVSINKLIEGKKEISSLLAKAGATRITALGDNSRMLAGESHDGEYALRRYIRVVETIK
ncbi:MAG: hypothetical protein IKP56_00745 [Bacilli bacterium]|nr:hypothetical protein [Bacilli bacterium]